MVLNGEPKQVPAIQVGWDNDLQDVAIGFDPKQFRTWDFIMAILQMAVLRADNMRRATAAQQMMQAQQEAQQQAIIAANLRRSH